MLAVDCPPAADPGRVTDDLIAACKQAFGQIRTVLAGNSCNQGFFHSFSFLQRKIFYDWIKKILEFIFYFALNI